MKKITSYSRLLLSQTALAKKKLLPERWFIYLSLRLNHLASEAFILKKYRKVVFLLAFASTSFVTQAQVRPIITYQYVSGKLDTTTTVLFKPTRGLFDSVKIELVRKYRFIDNFNTINYYTAEQFYDNYHIATIDGKNINYYQDKTVATSAIPIRQIITFSLKLPTSEIRKPVRTIQLPLRNNALSDVSLLEYYELTVVPIVKRQYQAIAQCQCMSNFIFCSLKFQLENAPLSTHNLGVIVPHFNCGLPG